MPTFRSYSGELAGKLKDYRSRAQKEASKNRPPPDAAAPDQHESELKSEAEGCLSAEQAIFDTAVTEASRTATEAGQKAIELKTCFDQLLRDDSATSSVEAELEGERPQIVKATEARLRTEAEIRYFRATNNIHEEAVYPESRWWHFGVLAILAVVEVMVNAFFYENSQGLLGGITVAAGIAALNMASALALGYLFRFKNLASLEKKALGWTAFVVFVAIVIFCNALFASFRSEYQIVVDPTEVAQVTEAFRKAWPEAVLIFKADMQFKDHWSFILFGVGVLLSLWAFWKGYTLDDKYPGYGALDRKYKAVVSQELLLQDRVRQKVKEMLHHRKAAVHAAIHEPATQVGMLARRIADVAHAKGVLESQAAAIRRDFALIVEAYRHANAAIRAVSAPPYFKEPAVLSTPIDGTAMEGVMRNLSAVQTQLQAMADTHRDSLNDKLMELQDDTSNILKQTVTAYFAEIRAEAEEAIARTQHVPNRIQVA